MCSYIAEGRLFKKCRHFVRLQVVAMLDCGSRLCELSIQHPKSCKNRSCTNYLGKEIQKPIVTYDEFCWACQSTGHAVAA
ncbi:hypothetical protein SCHPADRAFT_461228 [Schizopora paradoxa]|uniref:Uncharacterized protein n=1 Tax=Schizopora paradoxa TaxID=27342 RepID=A0A0H2S3W8_9AGAM|nr:hypothetical protein SCHPADRAFT_461228 [Schizopora paradoxa]